MWKPTTSSDALYHSAKGTHWGKHKYIAIKNGRYIYPEDKTDAYKKAQKSGKRRTLREQTKQARAGELREMDAFDRAAREQEKGRNKTAYYTKQQKGNYANSSAAAARYKKQAEIASGGRSLKTTNTKYATSRESFETSKPAQAEVYEKKAKIAESVFKQGQTAQNNNRANTGRYGGMASYNSKRGKKPKNKTARKNQRRAKIESAAFKAKRISKKAVSKGKSIFSKFIKR